MEADEPPPPTLADVIAAGQRAMQRALRAGNWQMAFKLAVLLLPFENEPIKESKSQ